MRLRFDGVVAGCDRGRQPADRNLRTGARAAALRAGHRYDVILDLPEEAGRLGQCHRA